MNPSSYNETPVYRVFAEDSPRLGEELYLTLCGIEQCRPDKERESRVRDSYHLHVVLSGCGTLETRSSSAQLREGQLFLIKPGEKITYYPDPQNPWAYCWMSFDGTQADALMREAGFEEGVYCLESHVHVSKYYQLCSASLDSPQLTHAAALRRFGLLVQFIATAIESRDWERGGRRQKGRRPLHNKQDYIRYAIDYIGNNYSSITLRDVSDYLGINYNYFSAIFKQSQSISPNEYLLQIRMRQASQMLVNLTIDIQNIANFVGYSDSLTFSKAFKRFFGVSPKFYREMPADERPIFDRILETRRNDGQE
jgi:AraC family transcriptional regulator of arabinose operon